MAPRVELATLASAEFVRAYLVPLSRESVIEMAPRSAANRSSTWQPRIGHRHGAAFSRESLIDMAPRGARDAGAWVAFDNVAGDEPLAEFVRAYLVPLSRESLIEMVRRTQPRIAHRDGPAHAAANRSS